jgi:hypothetical protein
VQDAESGAEVALVIEADLLPDFRDGLVGVGQKLFGLGDAKVIQITDE